jgi:hypothetical protein
MASAVGARLKLVTLGYFSMESPQANNAQLDVESYLDMAGFTLSTAQS